MVAYDIVPVDCKCRSPEICLRCQKKSRKLTKSYSENSNVTNNRRNVDCWKNFLSRPQRMCLHIYLARRQLLHVFSESRLYTMVESSADYYPRKCCVLSVLQALGWYAKNRFPKNHIEHPTAQTTLQISDRLQGITTNHDFISKSRHSGTPQSHVRLMP
jgi:hypothetical protein